MCGNAMHETHLNCWYDDFRHTTNSCHDRWHWQARWTLKVHTFECSEYELFDFYQQQFFSLRINFLHFLLCSWRIFGKRANNKTSYFIEKPCTPKVFYDRILEIIWHYPSIGGQIWDGNTSKAIASGEKRFFLFFLSVQFQTTMSIFILWLFFVLFASQPLFSFSFRRIFIRFFIWKNKIK